jgi:hypothetical protein
MPSTASFFFFFSFYELSLTLILGTKFSFLSRPGINSDLSSEPSDLFIYWRFIAYASIFL